MICAFVCVKDRMEREMLRKVIRELAARLSDSEWSIQGFASAAETESTLNDIPALLCCDATGAEALEGVRRMRRRWQESRILLLADRSISPLEYLRPQIMASSLLLRPYKREELQQVAEEFLRSYLDEFPDETRSLVIKAREGRMVVPYDSIYYLEAREKKIFVRLNREEYSLYGTLDGLLQTLPEQFVRTHRSYVVNKKFIRQVRLADGFITLQDGFIVPLSRRYRAEIKEFLYE